VIILPATGKAAKYYVLLCFISDISAGYSTSILNAMRVALHASLALSLNLTSDLPAGYTALTLAEGFYLATLGGAEGTYVVNVHTAECCCPCNCVCK